MSTLIYRFRRLDQILGPAEGFCEGRDELRNQTIFFPPPSLLNDPVEGFKDIVWSGDEIIWRNLLEHYLICLQLFMSLLALSGTTVPFGREHIPVWQSKARLPSPQFEIAFKRIRAAFFADKSISELPSLLANRLGDIRSNELALYLSFLHPFALQCVHDDMVHQGQMTAWPRHLFPPIEPAVAKLTCEKFNNLETDHPNIVEGPEQLALAMSLVKEQSALLARLQSPLPQMVRDNQLFVMADFSKEYVTRLADLIHADWYTACFSGTFANSSMWGNYAENHTGICLIFRGQEAGGRFEFPLHKMNGFNSGGPTYGKMPVRLHRVEYKAKREPINFFKSIGRMTVPDLKATWLVGSDGERSIVCDELFSSADARRNYYWDAYIKAVTTKTPDWEYEKEIRLILESDFLDYSDPKDRCLRYDFDSLDGIIFGVKTPIEHKLAVLKILREKCLQPGRIDLKIFQSAYNKNTGNFDKVDLSLIKMT